MVEPSGPGGGMAIRFRIAVEAGDLDAAIATLAPDVVLHSPVTFRPFQGKESVGALFSILFRTFFAGGGRLVREPRPHEGRSRAA